MIDVRSTLMYTWNTHEADWKNVFNIVLGPAEIGYHIKAFESSNCWMEVVHINGGLSVSKVVPRLIFRPPIQFRRLNPQTHSVLTVEQEKRSIFSDRKSFSFIIKNFFHPGKFYTKYSFSMYSIVSLSQFGFAVKAKDNLELTMPHRISSGCH